MSEKQVVKVLMAFGHIGLAMSIVFVLFSIVGITFDRHPDYANIFLMFGASLLSAITFVAFIGFAYIVKYVCKVED